MPIVELSTEIRAPVERCFDRPTHFQDVMTRGAFARMRHDHRFEQRDGETTVMRDDFDFQAPFGVVGGLVSAAILTRYLRRFLVERAAMLKATAESDAWRRYLQVSDPA